MAGTEPAARARRGSGQAPRPPVEAFEWYPVDKAVVNVKNHGRELIKRMNDPLL